MSEEVKELIDTLKEYGNGFTSVLAPTEESVKALLDYINQLETTRDEALNLMEKCKFDKTDKYIAISEYKEYQELKAILERGKE